MTLGVGGSTAEIELAKISDMTVGVQPIQKEEYQQRIQKAAHLMREQNIVATYINAGTNLYYFTGTKWNASERMVGAILTQKGTLEYIVPKFEDGTFLKYRLIEGELKCWEEHESPYALVGAILKEHGFENGTVGIDESASFFLADGLVKQNTAYDFVTAQPITAGCRMQKSENEIAIIQRAKEMTIVVQKAAAKIMRVGISVKEVETFIHKAHIKAGAKEGSYFVIVLFGEDSQFPHGVDVAKNLAADEIVLVDTGCQVLGYISDITRTYVFGTPSPRQKEIWDLEKATQLSAFNAAQIGVTCGSVDDAARKTLAENGLSPDYDLPGLPHRVGHGTGLDIHEFPYLVRGNKTILKEGMVLSNEPMICVPGEFGIRHEDHFYMTARGPKWFTQPMKSIDNPFDL